MEVLQRRDLHGVPEPAAEGSLGDVKFPGDDGDGQVFPEMLADVADHRADPAPVPAGHGVGTGQHPAVGDDETLEQPPDAFQKEGRAIQHLRDDLVNEEIGDGVRSENAQGGGDAFRGEKLPAGFGAQVREEQLRAEGSEIPLAGLQAAAGFVELFRVKDGGAWGGKRQGIPVDDEYARSAEA